MADQLVLKKKPVTQETVEKLLTPQTEQNQTRRSAKEIRQALYGSQEEEV